MSNKKTRDMTSGNIWAHLIYFAIPLILGNLFQLTYNAVDSILVGRFAGDQALAAVGTSDPIMNLMILGITGMCIGSSVIMSHFYGAGDYENIKNEMATSLILGTSLSIFVMFLGFLLCNPIMSWMNVPKEAWRDALLYFRVILIGMPFTCLYNVYAAGLRSVGDSRTPLIFLAISSCLNAGLDLLFLTVFHMGVLGAGLATDLAVILSAILCIVYVSKNVPLLKMNLTHFKIHKTLLGDTVRYGGTSALQQCSQPIGKLFIQGMVNTLGVSTMAAFNAVGKIEDFALVPERNISNAMMTFGAQNYGARQEERIREGFFCGQTIEILYGIFIGLLLFFIHPVLLSPFSTNAGTLMEGSRYFQIMAFFYLLPGLTNGFQGYFRGYGKMKVTLYGTILQITIRVLVTWFLLKPLGIAGVTYACAAGWIAMLVLQNYFYHKIIKK